MSVSLYELKGAFREALELEVSGPEDAEAMIALIDEAANDIENKCINIGYVIKTLKYEQDILKAEEEELRAKRKVRENKVARLKDYVFQAMKETGLDKAEAVDIKVSIAKTPAHLVVLDETAVPEEFWKVERSMMKRELLAYVKDNPDCDYAETASGETVRIK